MDNQITVEQNTGDSADMPEWAQEFSLKYCAKTVNLYFVSGNIRDLLPYRFYENGLSGFSFLDLKDWISHVLFQDDAILIFFDSSQGLSFGYPQHRKRYEAIMSEIYPEVNPYEFFSNDPATALSYLEKFFRYTYANIRNNPTEDRVVLILDYAETIIPSGDIGMLSEADRYCLVTLQRWAHDPQFLRQDISIVMLTENFHDINSHITSLSSMVKIEVPLPDESTRIRYLNYLAAGKEPDLYLVPARGVSIAALGKQSAGLNLKKIYQVVADAYQSEIPITLEYLTQKKKEAIEADTQGLLEFVESKHNLDFVAGNEFVKKRLKLAAKAIKTGHNEAVPMGYLLSGAIGTGKTFLVSAFANEIHIPMVKIGNLGGTLGNIQESKMKRVLDVLKELAPVAVMIDEADVLLGGSRNKKSTSAQTAFFSQLSNFMGNTEHRGKIIWFLITCRPDLLPIDLKRQGRAEEHLSLFYPETDLEKEELFKTLQAKLNVKLTKVDLQKIIKKIKFDVSGADIESILVRAKLKASGENREMITEDDLTEVIADFLPPTYSYDIELQNLVAALECTSKELIPKRYQNKDRGSLLADINQLKQILGETG